MVNDIAVQDFVNAIKEDQIDTSTTYNAIVSRIDDEGVVWVNLYGSKKETPTASTSSEVKRGDIVPVTWRNNKLYIGGNYSNPSVGVMRVANAENSAALAFEAANNAETDAARARVAAESAEADAYTAAQAAASAQQSASSAGENASRAQAASQAAQSAALASLTTDTIHYLATPQGSGVTRNTTGWTTTVQTMTSVNKYLWTYHTYTTAGGASSDTDPVITGTYGEKGADGTSVTILGSYNTLAELQAEHPTGSLGDAYMVSGDLYVWNGSAWQDVGQIQGPQGPQGIQGDSISVQSIAYAVTATESEPLTYPYSSAPTVPEGYWLWTKTTFSDGSSAIMKAKQGEKGDTPTITTTKDGRTTTIKADGVSIGTVLDGTNGTSPTVSKSGDTVTITDASGTTVTIKDGEDGTSIKGDDGDDAFMHIAWANSADGMEGFSTTVATNKLYMGTYTDHIQADSQAPQSYKWVRVKGEQGVQGIQGEQGIQGLQGDEGVSVVSVQPQYCLHTSDSTPPASTATWTTSLTYVIGKFIWTRDYITYSDNTHDTSEEIYNEALTQSCYNAATALGLVQEQQEYFWHDSLGAHVLSSTDTSGTRHRTDIKGAGLEIFELDGQTEASIAKFGSTQRVGKETGTNTNLVATSSGISFRSGTTQFGQLGAYDSTTLGATMQNLKLASEPSANSYGRIKLSASSASGTGIPSDADLIAKKGSAEAGVYVTADQDSGGDHADVLILGQNIALHVGYGDDYIRVLNGSSTTVATLGTNGNMALEGYLTVGGHRAIDRNFICYANSRVDNFVDGQITLSLATLGITTGAKPVGILMTYQDGGATPTILRYDYDASSASGVVIKAYNSSGGAVSGNVRYFAAVFQNTWTSA